MDRALSKRASICLWIYRISFLPVLAVILPYYLRRMLRRGGYASTLHQRIGLMRPLPQKKFGHKRIWLQAVSVGELKAVGRLIHALSQYPNVELVLTTTTSTAYQLALKWYKDQTVYIGMFPLDFWPFSARTWSRIQPDLCLLMERELWPEHLQQAKQRGVPIYLINARLSERSFKRYYKIRWAAQQLFEPLTLILASTELEGQRYTRLGLDPSKVHCVGNLKFDLSLMHSLSPQAKADLKARCGFRAEALLLIGASTWPGEDKILLDVLQAALAKGITCGLILVPRHAERAKALVALMENYTFSWRLHSTLPQQPHPLASPIQVHIVDTTGALTDFLQIADIALIGKSFPPHFGGQTPIEAAGAGLPIVYGPNMQNFESICKNLESAKAAIRVGSHWEAHSPLLHLLQAADTRSQMSHRATAFLSAYQGATEKTLELLNLQAL